MYYCLDVFACDRLVKARFDHAGQSLAGGWQRIRGCAEIRVKMIRIPARPVRPCIASIASGQRLQHFDALDPPRSFSMVSSKSMIRSWASSGRAPASRRFTCVSFLPVSRHTPYPATLLRTPLPAEAEANWLNAPVPAHRSNLRWCQQRLRIPLKREQETQSNRPPLPRQQLVSYRMLLHRKQGDPDR
jgi:hypothetical protein